MASSNYLPNGSATRCKACRARKGELAPPPGGDRYAGDSKPYIPRSRAVGYIPGSGPQRLCAVSDELCIADSRVSFSGDRAKIKVFPRAACYPS